MDPKVSEMILNIIGSIISDPGQMNLTFQISNGLEIRFDPTGFVRIR
jgi:hypothetical protein